MPGTELLPRAQNRGRRCHSARPASLLPVAQERVREAPDRRAPGAPGLTPACRPGCVARGRESRACAAPCASPLCPVPHPALGSCRLSWTARPISAPRNPRLLPRLARRPRSPQPPTLSPLPRSQPNSPSSDDVAASGKMDTRQAGGKHLYSLSPPPLCHPPPTHTHTCAHEGRHTHSAHKYRCTRVPPCTHTHIPAPPGTHSSRADVLPGACQPSPRPPWCQTLLWCSGSESRWV